MGQHYIQASGLILVGLYVNNRDGVPISLLVGALGLLQPTVSMSVGSLTKRGLVARPHIEGSSARSTFVVLTEEGRESIQVLVDKIVRLVVRRRPRM